MLEPSNRIASSLGPERPSLRRECRSVITEVWRARRIAPRTLFVCFVVLAIALSTAIVALSVADTVVIRPLPYESPRRLLAVSAPGSKPGTFGPVTPQDYYAWLDRAQAFTSLAASRPTTPLPFEHSGATERLVTRLVTPNLFATLGVRPQFGRLFAPDDDPTSGTSVVLGYQAWSRFFGADTTIVGKVVRFGPTSFEVIGVLPENVWHPLELSPPDVYRLYLDTPAERANARAASVAVVGRLRSGVTLAQARADIARVSQRPTLVTPLEEVITGPAARWLLLLFAASVLVLLIASANVSTLLVARTLNRSLELSIRYAFGQSRRTAVTALAIESIWLTTSALGAALFVALAAVRLLKSTLPSGLLTRDITIGIDGRVVLGAVALSIAVAGIVTIPMLFAVPPEPAQAVSSHGPSFTPSKQAYRWLHLILAFETATICFLMVATGLVVQSFVRLMDVDLGFNRRNVYAISYDRPHAGDPSAPRATSDATLRMQVLSEVQSRQGVEAAAIVTNATDPLSGASVRYTLVLPSGIETSRDDMIETRIVTPGYFNLMGMELLSGRLFSEADGRGAPSVMLINAAAAKRFFGGQDPVGQVVTFRGATTIIGVLKSVRFGGPESDIRPEMYIPADQELNRNPRDFGDVLLRASGNSRAAAESARDAIRSALGVEPGPVRSIDESFRKLTAVRRFDAGMMAVLGSVAGILGVIGVYSTCTFIVVRQTREIGVRLAIGASRSSVVRSVMARALRTAAIGVLLGLGAAWASSVSLRALVFDISVRDPRTYVSVASIVLLLTAAAAFAPAVRAASTDPTESLRRE